MDHLYDFLLPAEPWLPAGAAAQLAGASLLVLAFALLALPWALTGRRPGPGTVTALLATVLVMTDVGLATLRSGLDGAVVSPVAPDVVSWSWIVALPVLVGYLGVLSRSWAGGAAAVLLVLASPLVAFSSYAIGPFDTQPWWEAVSGLLTCAAGACVLVLAVRRPARRREAVPEPAVLT